MATWVNRTGNYFHQNNNTPLALLRQPVAQLTKFVRYTFLVVLIGRDICLKCVRRSTSSK